MKEGWESMKLGECLSYIKNGANIKQTKGAIGIPITRIETLSGGTFHRDRLGFADIFDASKYALYILDDADILMSHINSKAFIGRSVIYHKLGEEQIIHGMNLLRLKFFTNLINPEFANYYFKCLFFRNEIAKHRKDAVNQSSIAIADLKKITIPRPPLSEQQQIVEELDLLSSIIEKKKEQLKELDNLAQAIFYDMFGDPVTNEKGWEVEKLSTVCDVRDGTHDSPKYVDKGYPLITSKNVVNGSLSFENVNFITEKDLNAINVRSKVDDGDIIMPMIGTIGKPVIVKKIREFAIKNVALIKFTESKNVLNIYIQKLLDNKIYSIFLKGLNQGVTQKFVSLKTIRQLPIPLPPISLQQQFATKIEAIERQKELVKQSIKEVETLFNSRMDYYFN